MPSKSAKQARTMRAAAHDPKFAKRMGIPQKVAKEYMEEDMEHRMFLPSMERRKRGKGKDKGGGSKKRGHEVA